MSSNTTGIDTNVRTLDNIATELQSVKNKLPNSYTSKFKQPIGTSTSSGEGFKSDTYAWKSPFDAATKCIGTASKELKLAYDELDKLIKNCSNASYQVTKADRKKLQETIVKKLKIQDSNADEATIEMFASLVVAKIYDSAETGATVSIDGTVSGWYKYDATTGDLNVQLTDSQNETPVNNNTDSNNNTENNSNNDANNNSTTDNNSNSNSTNNNSTTDNNSNSNNTNNNSTTNNSSNSNDTNNNSTTNNSSNSNDTNNNSTTNNNSNSNNTNNNNSTTNNNSNSNSTNNNSTTNNNSNSNNTNNNSTTGNNSNGNNGTVVNGGTGNNTGNSGTSNTGSNSNNSTPVYETENATVEGLETSSKTTETSYPSYKNKTTTMSASVKVTPKSKTKTNNDISSNGTKTAGIIAGAAAVPVVGLAANAIHKKAKENDELDLDENRPTNGNKFWSDRKSNIINSEEDFYDMEDLK